ncbi:carboxypeptidase-like regulatory domain-containing protein [Blastopirellula retiformator]|uniref:Carboxypeptidase regulatory-like domain-containing protein n=1 Tax=Blastopirellula retiformator TaxID=2527970 RepID=A0A5C5V1U2_9BACT|nr:carboxypeptidase-like regulatory domain-containing protein [Blastopirellula retiformator]TWT31930.1 hypothetical protein Enr8_38560 [Blastopirellula retiformator]
MKFKFAASLACVALVAVTVIGCGKTKTFSGSVSMDGAPLASAGVQLIPEGGGKGVHFSTTDEQGNFTIVEESANPLSAGEYVVVVDKAPTEMGGKSVVADIYRDQKKTPLKMTISDGSTKLPPIELSAHP